MVVLTERRLGVERERGVTVDAAVIAPLEAEAARLTSELAAADNGAVALVPDLEQLAEREATLTEARQAFERSGPTACRSRPVRRLRCAAKCGALRSGVERADEELERAWSRLVVLTAKDERLGAEAQGLRRARRCRCHRGAARRIAGRGRGCGRGRHGRRRRRRGGPSQGRGRGPIGGSPGPTHSSWRSNKPVRRPAPKADRRRRRRGHPARPRRGRRRLGSRLRGRGGDALSAVVVESTASGRQAIEALRSDDTSGSIVALGAELPDRSAPAVGTPLRPHVRATRPDVDRLLDGLIGHVTRIDGDWKAAVDASLSHPGAVVVTAGGDRFSAEGWRVRTERVGCHRGSPRRGPGDAPTTPPRQQPWRSSARKRPATAWRRWSRPNARSAPTSTPSTASAPQPARHFSASRPIVARPRPRSNRCGVTSREVTDRLDSERARGSPNWRIGCRSSRQPRPTRPIRPGRWRPLVEQLDERNRAVNTVRADLELRAAGLDDRRQFLQRRLTEVEARLEGNRSARDEAAERRVGLDARLLALDALSVRVAEAEVLLEDALGRLRRRRQAQTEVQRTQATALDGYRRARTEAEHELEEVRERLRRAEIEETELKLRVEIAVETMRRDLDIDPAATLERRVSRARGRRGPRGPCPRARAGAAAHGTDQPAGPRGVRGAAGAPRVPPGPARRRQRHSPRADQGDPRRSTRRSSTSSPRRSPTCSQNFEQLFADAVPRRRGSLTLTEPDDLLDTGIEIEAKPSGKNVRKLSLLTGGERSLTALAFLFAVFRSRPSPFYVMDEVEAALDDVNLHRFLDLVARVPPGGAAADRQPPEAHDGGRRLPLRRHDAARWQQPSGEREDLGRLRSPTSVA